MPKMRSGGLLALGAFAIGLALARPAVADDRLSVDQPRAEQAIAKAQAAREAITQAQAQSAQPPSRRQEHLLVKADDRLEHANRYYEAGRYRDAARAAADASRMIAKASVPVRDHGKTKEVQ